MNKSPFNILFFCALCVFSIGLFAQPPGYMGKRFSASYGMHLVPTFNRNTSNNGFISAKHEANIGLCLSDRWQMCASAEFYRTIYKNVLSINLVGEPPANFYTIKGGNYGLLFKKFRKGYVAPWGSYSMMGVQVNKYAATYNNYMYYTARAIDHDTLISDFGPPTQSFMKADFVFGWGKSRVFKDKIIVDWGAMFRLRSLLSAMGSSLASFWVLDSDNYIKRTSAIRTNRLNAWDFYIRVGYLF